MSGPIYETDLFGKVLVGWSRKWIAMREMDNGDADQIVEARHYSGKATQNRFCSMGVYYEGVLEGVLQLGYGIRPKIKGTWGGAVTPGNSREFDRMWLSDKCPKFSETITLSCLKRYVHHKYPAIKYLLSYADGTVGNVGTIYKAGNYKYVGSNKADFYILPSGERVHPVSMYHRHGSRAWGMLQERYPGIKKAEGKQHRFILSI